MYDLVHIIKCIWNNWINQKDPLTTLIFPTITDYFNDTLPYQLATASVQDIRNLYKVEQFSNAKTAHKLTSQAVWPSTFERQSVPLALAVWDQSTHNARAGAIGGVLGVQTPTASCFIILYNIYPSINEHPLSGKSF